MANEIKTNVMRVLDSKKIKYASHCYDQSGAISGTDVAKALGQNEEQVFKTLVTAAKSKQHYVFLVPVAKELDLKKGAKAVGEKSLEMIPQKELLPLTGYIHGGCSPIGMKKQFQTVVDISAESFETIIFSAGKIGYQVEMKLSDLAKVIRLKTFDITK